MPIGIPTQRRGRLRRHVDALPQSLLTLIAEKNSGLCVTPRLRASALRQQDRR